MTGPGDMSPATREFENGVIEALIALGLYTACFEAMTFACRDRMGTYIDLHANAWRPAFDAACRTAEKTFEFCWPHLVALGVVPAEHLAQITRMRQRRNDYAHNGFSRIPKLRLSELQTDIDLMHEITNLVLYWRIEGSAEALAADFPPGLRASFTVDPIRATSLARRVATRFVATRLSARVGQQTGDAGAQE